MSVLLIGATFAIMATRPAALIISAQATNALLLPIVALVMVLMTNSEALLGHYRNGRLTNLAAAVTVALVTALALNKLWALV